VGKKENKKTREIKNKYRKTRKQGKLRIKTGEQEKKYKKRKGKC